MKCYSYKKWFHSNLAGNFMNRWKKPVLIGGSVVAVAAAVLAFNIYAPDTRDVGTGDAEALNAKSMDAEKAESEMAQAKSADTKAADAKKGNRKIASAGSVYVVQVGAFKVKENADRLLAQLKAQGFSAEIHTINHSKNGILHVVRMQPTADRSEAHAMVESLKAKTQMAAAVMMEPVGGG